MLLDHRAPVPITLNSLHGRGAYYNPSRAAMVSPLEHAKYMGATYVWGSRPGDRAMGTHCPAGRYMLLLMSLGRTLYAGTYIPRPVGYGLLVVMGKCVTRESI